MAGVNTTSTASYLSPIGSSSFLPANNAMIDPGTATLIGTGISSIVSGAGGAAAGKGAKSAAQQAREAAAEQARSVVEANRENLMGGFGLDYATKKAAFTTTDPMSRWSDIQDAFASRALEQGPGAQAERRQQMAQNLAERQAQFTGFLPPAMARFV